MVKPIQSDFLHAIRSEIKLFTKNETYINANDPLGILIHEIFQVTAHTRYSGDNTLIDRRIKNSIKTSIERLENMIVELAIKYEGIILEHHNQIIDPQKFIDYIQTEAEKLSFSLYPKNEIRILRNFHIYYLTYVKASSSLISARINKAHSDIRKIAKDQRFRGDPLNQYDHSIDEPEN